MVATLYGAWAADKLRGGGGGGRDYGAKSPLRGEQNQAARNYQRLYEQLQRGQHKEGLAAFYENLLENFEGYESDLTEFMERNAPMMAASSLQGTEAFKQIQDFEQFNTAQQAYGVGAGKIGQAATRGAQRAQGQMAGAGLGRSASMQALAGQAAATSGAQQADLYTGLYQQGQAQRQQSIAQAFDAHRMVANMALAHNPNQQAAPQGDDGIWGALGGAAGAIIGANVGGPAGSAAGAQVGTQAGNKAGNQFGYGN